MNEVSTKSVLLLVLIGIVGLVEPAGAATQARHQRDSWYIGLGYGLGLAAQWNADGKTITFGDWVEGLHAASPYSLNLKVGGTLSPRTLLGLDITQAAQNGSKDSVIAGALIRNTFLMLTYFPNREGFFVRGGAGWSHFVANRDTASGDLTIKTDGLGVLGGIGYAFWLGRSFNLTLNLDQSFQRYSSGSGEPDSGQFTILYLGADWY